ncbi:MAG: hypothetical protein ABFD51_10825 [Anaerolineaceae bacterium]
MQIRCYHCHKPFALSQEAVHAALTLLTEEKLHYYDARCPHCGKSNRIALDALQRAAPNWKPGEQTQEDAKQ